LVILVDLYRHGHFDSSAYQSYMAGELENFEMPELKPEAALEHLPEVPAPD
jgi:tryptophan synthase beta chain